MSFAPALERSANAFLHAGVGTKTRPAAVVPIRFGKASGDILDFSLDISAALACTNDVVNNDKLSTQVWGPAAPPGPAAAITTPVEIQSDSNQVDLVCHWATEVAPGSGLITFLLSSGVPGEWYRVDLTVPLASKRVLIVSAFVWIDPDHPQAPPMPAELIPEPSSTVISIGGAPVVVGGNEVSVQQRPANS